MNECITVVNMDSFTKERPRANFYTKTIYTPPATVKREKYIAQEFRIQNMKWGITSEPIIIDIDIEVNVPSNARKKEREEMRAGKIHPIKKPDVDNVAKLVLDALQGVAYEDDYQVVELNVRKKYGERKKLTIRIKKYEKI